MKPHHAGGTGVAGEGACVHGKMMNKILTALAITMMFSVPSANGQADKISIVPRPQRVSIEERPGDFILTKKTQIVADTDEGRRTASMFNEALNRVFGFKLPVVSKGKIQASTIYFDLTNRGPGESYNLSVSPEQIMLNGGERGLFYATQTLLQLLPTSTENIIRIPKIKIVDQPRFPYRGMHLDVSRHFMPVEFIKKYIDLMSQYKFNYFHWHLTDDQGWRIEIKKYPKLTEIGSKRPESHLGPYTTTFKGDGVPVEGFYTQEQIKEVVAYAKARYITVIPEIELPGHSSAALAAYPEVGCKQDYKYKVQMTWGIFKEVYCPTEKTFGFLDDVLTEVIGLFPDSPYIHVGGDEVLKDMWKESPEVKELMTRENLKDEHEVQSYFIRRMEKFINSKGKKIIGWDEILEGGLAPNATVMSWRGIKGGIEAAKAHHDVIMTPTDYAYFDFNQGDPTTEPLNIGGYLPLEKVYNFDPLPKELSPDEAKYILGGQANIWTEYLQNGDRVEYMAFPRMLALSEVLWTKPDDKNFADFTSRLSSQFARLDKQNVNYRIPEPAGLVNRILAANDRATVELTAPIPGSTIRYTIDGQTPDETSQVYTKPLELDVPAAGRVDVKTIVVLPTGRKSSVYTATFVRRDMLPSVELADKRVGLTYGLVSWRSDGVPEPLVMSGETKNLGLQQFSAFADTKKAFAVTFNGYFNAPVDDMYEFQIDSTYTAGLDIDSVKMIDDSGKGDRKSRSAVIPLKAGLHKISLRYANSGGDPFFRVRWAIKGQQWRNLGGTGELFH